MIRLLGVDPGSHRLGWGLVDFEGQRAVHVAHGTLVAASRDPLERRLLVLYRGFCEVLDQYRPASAGIERVFAARNLRSALTLGHARGMVLLALAERDVSIEEYAPSEIKASVGAHGHGSKEQVGAMVSRLLGVSLAEADADASDALAVALCHGHGRQRRRVLRRIEDAI